MAGYSGASLAKKLGIKPGATVVALNAPPSFARSLEVMPSGTRLLDALPRKAAGADVVVLFCGSAKDLIRGFPRCRKAMRDNAGFWVAWPKKSSGVLTDLDENKVREIALAKGLVDNKVCAIDATWSGLRLVVRLKDRVASEYG